MASSLLPPVPASTKTPSYRNSKTYQYMSHDKDVDMDNRNTDEEEPMIPLQMKSAGGFSFLSTSSLKNRGGGGRGQSYMLSERKKIVMAIALFSTYFSVMGAKCALPATFNLLIAPDSGLKFTQEPQQIMSRVLTISTAAIAVGKFVLGPIIDRFGGTFCLKIALSMLMAALGLIASTKSFSIFAFSWILVDFIFSSCWAACLSSIHLTFPEEDWASRIGSLAVAGRVGNAFSFFTFAYVLQWAQQRQMSSSWRLVFWVSSLMQLIPLTMFAWFYRVGSRLDRELATDEIQESDAHQTQQHVSIKDSLSVLRNESKTISFWMHLISRSCLMIVASFLLFVPSYMTNAFGMSNSSAARVGSIYALGSLISVSLGAKRFSASDKRTKIITSVMLLGSLLGCCFLQLAHIAGRITMSPACGAISMFVWGFAFSIPFYIPPSMYALRRGGRQSSATIADAFDFVGFMMLAWFNGFVASRPQDILTSWYSPFAVLTGCSLLSLLSLVAALVSQGFS